MLVREEENAMVTTSEVAATAIIWVLAVFGGFFGIRAAWRRRRKRHGDKDNDGK